MAVTAFFFFLLFLGLIFIVWSALHWAPLIILACALASLTTVGAVTLAEGVALRAYAWVAVRHGLDEPAGWRRVSAALMAAGAVGFLACAAVMLWSVTNLGTIVTWLGMLAYAA